MRHVLTGLGALIVVMAASVQPLPAVELPRPWCLEGGIMQGGLDDCSFHTFSQCKASGANGAAACYPNKLWLAQEQGRQPPVAKRPTRERRSN